MDMRNESERIVIPEGWHEFKVINIEEQCSKAGNMMFKITLELTKTKGGIEIYAVAEEGKRWFLKQFLSACGVMEDEEGNYNWEIPDLLDLPIEGRVELEDNEWIGRDGTPRITKRSKVVEFKAPDE